MKFSESMLQYKNVCGIYKIVCSEADFYIGSSKNIQQRFYKHRRELRKGVHKNEHLQNAYNKYEEKCFSLEIIEVCNIDEQYLKEQYYIDLLQPTYNKELDVVTHIPTEETKKKLSEANKKYYANPDNLKKRYKTIYRFNEFLEIVNTYEGIKPNIEEWASEFGIKPGGADKGINRALASGKLYKGSYWSYDQNFKGPTISNNC